MAVNFMAFASIDYTAAIWQSWGLKYIFRPKTGFPGPSSGSAPAMIMGRPKAGQGSWRERHAHAPAASLPQNSQPSSSGQAQTPIPAHRFKPLPQEQWGKLWREQFAKTKPGKIAWTYWLLAADLAGEKHPLFNASGRDKRREVMGKLLKALGHPAGTHTFWPAQLDTEPEAKAEPEIFWSGVKLLGCRGLLIFGSQAAWPLLNTREARPLQTYKPNGVFVYVLNDLDRLAANAEQFGQTVIFLRSNLHIFVR